MKLQNAEAAWVDANQRFLVGEFARIKERLGIGADSPFPNATQAARKKLAKPYAIDRVTDLFGLSEFERDLLLLCAGVEMDSEIGARCGETQGTPQRATATYGLALATLADPHWSALTPSRPLRRFRLVELEPGRGITSSPLRIDERILHLLAGVNAIDSRLESMVEPAPEPEWIASQHVKVADRVFAALKDFAQDPPIIHLCGDDPQGQQDVAARASGRMGKALYTVRSESLPSLGPDLDLFLSLWEREELLLPGALLIDCDTGGLTASARHVAERLPGTVFLASREPLRLNRRLLRMDVDKPSPAEQRRLWESALGNKVASVGNVLDDLSEQFRLSAKTIYTTSSLYGSKKSKDASNELWDMCRSISRPRLETLAQRVVPMADWKDLVLPDLQTQTLHQLAAQVRQRMTVYENWGFSAKGRRGLGVSALFCGESGTGKTLAAEVLARDLKLDLYRIDLSAVVSKYIGETEKNLKQVFDAAEEGGVLLLFDEADALFGKRSDVKDSHDRYANIEVGYLLQRMEAYEGLAILTTNMKSAMDRAFQRRLRFIVNFPFPDAEQRTKIWQRIFPPGAPTTGLRPEMLGQLNMAGGNIRNVALNAAFLAADIKKPIGMSHLLQAAKLEAQKIDRALSEAETRGWV